MSDESMRDSALERRLHRLDAPAEEPAPKDELAAIKAGQPVTASPEDDHTAHLVRHLNEKAAMQNKVLRGTVPAQQLTALEAHIEEHRQARGRR